MASCYRCGNFTTWGLCGNCSAIERTADATEAMVRQQGAYSSGGSSSNLGWKGLLASFALSGAVVGYFWYRSGQPKNVEDEAAREIAATTALPPSNGARPSKATVAGFQAFARTFFPGGNYTYTTSKGVVLEYGCTTTTRYVADDTWSPGWIEGSGYTIVPGPKGPPERHKRKFDIGFAFSAEKSPNGSPFLNENQWRCFKEEGREEVGSEIRGIDSDVACVEFMMMCSGGPRAARSPTIPAGHAATADDFELYRVTTLPGAAIVDGKMSYECSFGKPKVASSEARLTAQINRSLETLDGKQADKLTVSARFALVAGSGWTCEPGKSTVTRSGSKKGELGFVDGCAALLASCVAR